MDERYSKYLMSEEWMQRRIGCLMRVGKRCEACGNKDTLQVHHLTYARIFSEPLEDLMALCRACHETAEAFVKEGKIDRNGNVSDLRKLTAQLLNGKGNKPHSVSEKTSPKDIQADLMRCSDFVKALGTMDRKKFKKFVKSRFHRHPLQHKMESNAFTLFHKRKSLPVSESHVQPIVKKASDQELRDAFKREILGILTRWKARLGAQRVAQITALSIHELLFE